MKTTYELINSLNEGDVLEHGSLLSVCPDEPVTLTCLEVAPTDDSVRYTFHIHYLGVMLRAAIARLYPESRTVVWENAEQN